MKCCVPVAALCNFSDDILRSIGMEAEAADYVAHSLATADAGSLSRHSVVRLLPMYVRRLAKGSTNPSPNIRTVQHALRSWEVLYNTERSH